MKNFIQVCVLFVVLLFRIVYPSITFGQSASLGIPFIEHFSPKEYQAGILNYKITQDHRGYILVGNNKGVLEYDGVSWRVHEIEGNSRIRSILPDETGKIYIGTQNDIGYLWPNENGEYVFHSLRDLVPQEHAYFDDIWSIYESTRGVVFSCVQGLYIYDGHSISFIPFEKLNILSYPFNNNIYNQVMGNGLLVLDETSWKLTDQGDFFSDKEVRGINTHSDQHQLISTFEHGIYLVGKHKVKLWANQFFDIFSKNKILVTKRLKDGSYAIGTNTNGLYILDEEGNLMSHFTKGTGLKSRTILDVFEDSSGNLWVGQNNGISKIEWNSPFRLLNEDIGLSGTGYSSYATDSVIYLGTNNGLYYLEIDQNHSTTQVKKIEGIESQVYSIQEINGDILVGSHIGAYQIISGNKAREISGGVGWWIFKETNIPSVAIGGGYSGLFLLKKVNEKWIVEKYFDGFSESSRVMEFDKNDILWMSHGYKGVYSFRFSEGYDSIKEVNYYNDNHGLPSNFGINVFKVNGENIFTSTSGIYYFDERTQSFTPYEKYNDMIGSNTTIRYLLADGLGDIFFIGKGYSGVLQKSNWGYELDKKQTNKIHSLFNDDLERISTFNTDKILFAAREGFIQFDKSFTSRYSQEFDVAIRQINLTKSDSILFDGNFIADNTVVRFQNSDNVPNIPYSNNSIHIAYSALEYDEVSPVYRYRLVGYEDKWSEWINTTEKEYTNLFEGEYSFEVQGQNASGIFSAITYYKFDILPPWYRSSWALVVYFVILVCFSFWTIYFSSRNKKIISKQKIDLSSQGRQLKEVSEKSEEEINKLKNDKLVSEISLKKSQLTNTAMHLIDKNDFITSIQKSLDELVSDSELPKVKSKLKRIVSDIEKNKNDNEDWSQFEMLFNEVNNDFTKKIKAQYPKLSPQEIRLCLYLKMNLNTKEIANMSYVTPRAIEMSRYRLRKKLELDKEVNLNDFLMNF